VQFLFDDHTLDVRRRELRKGSELVGAYYYRNVELNPTFPPDTFTEAGMVALWTKADSVTLFDDFTYGAK